MCLRLGPFQKRGVCCGRKRTTQPQHVTSGRRSRVGLRSSRLAAGPELRGLPEGTAEHLDQASGVRGPGAVGVTSRARANFGFARVGKSVPSSGRAGRQLPGPSPTSPPPGFLRRLRPPCCCGTEAALRSWSGRDRLRNRFAVGGLATNPAAAAVEQGLRASACASAAGAEGRGIAL